MQFRHEWKHILHPADILELRQRLGYLLLPDPHAQIYTVRSLYFDSPEDKALLEKLNGVARREKFRIRCYNGDTAFLRLEKKSKLGNLCAKESAVLTFAEARSIAAGALDWMYQASDRPLLQELYGKMRVQRLQPKTLVEYSREAYIYPSGNVRVTLDSGIRTGIYDRDLIHCLTVPAGDTPVILEVKWDNYLPDIVRDAVQLSSRQATAFSKYAACRIYD